MSELRCRAARPLRRRSRRWSRSSPTRETRPRRVLRRRRFPSRQRPPATSRHLEWPHRHPRAPRPALLRPSPRDGPSRLREWPRRRPRHLQARSPRHPRLPPLLARRWNQPPRGQIHSSAERGSEGTDRRRPDRGDGWSAEPTTGRTDAGNARAVPQPQRPVAGGARGCDVDAWSRAGSATIGRSDPASTALACDSAGDRASTSSPANIQRDRTKVRFTERHKPRPRAPSPAGSGGARRAPVAAGSTGNRAPTAGHASTQRGRPQARSTEH